MTIKWLFLIITTIYHGLASLLENRIEQPPGQLIDVGGYRLHLYCQGQGTPTVIIDHSLGGLDGYFLIDKIAEITRVCIYDRAGYGWSDISPKKRCSEEIVKELNILLEKANIQPPYILVGDSFGSYNVRLYAHYFPEKVLGLVLGDGLHEQEMLKMPLALRFLKYFFLSGFIFSILGAILGLIRLLGNLKVFELIKPELKKFPIQVTRRVKHFFYRPKHWLTMGREMGNLEESAKQVSAVKDLGNLPIVSVKSKTFFNPSIFNFYMPIRTVNKFRDKMHNKLLKLSSNCQQLEASKSSHFIWIDQPEIILEAIQLLLVRNE
ncbi:alpha/beta fold hydrolase [Gloeothece verrucosa]|uniref:Alpha/beta hydrolase fold protein n=1 Tax=Gloeothece verrucosa (strain PCC 7822) TaxID=497965 RepID=E0UK42_GLOV7|nr:alpha/beta hydrolase [Gloeothece verrucosa]ADN14678.1 alpha/beta hydrolase fold protein [Gloeothece verrucosa PCC 7822]